MGDSKEAIEGNKIIVALDGIGRTEAFKIAGLLKGRVWGFKINDLVYEDSEIIDRLKEFGNVFVDVKLYDIPNTIANSVKKISAKGADIITVHASGGIEMMRRAKERAGGSKIIAVTILTSKKQLENTESEVVRLTKESLEAGLDGVVCAGQDLEAVSRIAQMGSKLKVVPGIRPDWYTESDDQMRVVSPREAINRGADYLVIGRPITKSDDPLKALEKILGE